MEIPSLAGCRRCGQYEADCECCMACGGPEGSHRRDCGAVATTARFFDVVAPIVRKAFVRGNGGGSWILVEGVP